MKRKEPKCKYKNVMLLEENQLDNFINAKIIESTNFSSHVYVCTNGETAIEFLNNISNPKNVSPETFPEVLFIDLNMVLKGGIRFINYIKQISESKIRKAKIVISGSSVELQDKQKTNGIPNNLVFLHKPLTAKMLALL